MDIIVLLRKFLFKQCKELKYAIRLLLSSPSCSLLWNHILHFLSGVDRVYIVYLPDYN